MGKVVAGVGSPKRSYENWWFDPLVVFADLEEEGKVGNRCLVRPDRVVEGHCTGLVVGMRWKEVGLDCTDFEEGIGWAVGGSLLDGDPFCLQGRSREGRPRRLSAR